MAKRGRPAGSKNKPRVDIKSNGLNREQAVELMIDAFTALKQLPTLMKELEQYKRGYSNLKEAVAEQRKEEEKRKDQERRFKLAQQQGDIKSPVRSGIKNPPNNSNLTEHIDCAFQKSDTKPLVIDIMPSGILLTRHNPDREAFNPN